MKSNFKNLEKLSENLKNIKQEDAVPLTDLLSTSFLQENTPFSDLNTLFEQGGFNFETVEEFKEMDEDKLDSFISKNTKYESYKAMLGDAGAFYMKNLIFKGF